MVTVAIWKKSYDQPRQHIKKQRHYFADKGPSSQSYDFSSSHVWMWELDYKESWGLKNWCFGTVVLEKTLESHLECKEIQPVHPKGNQSWIFIGRTDAETDTPILSEKTLMLGKIEGGRRRGRQRMRWLDGINHPLVWWLNGYKFEQTPGVGDGQEGLACCSPWVCKESDRTEQLNWTECSH